MALVFLCLAVVIAIAIYFIYIGDKKKREARDLRLKEIEERLAEIEDKKNSEKSVSE